MKKVLEILVLIRVQTGKKVGQTGVKAFLEFSMFSHSLCLGKF